MSAVVFARRRTVTAALIAAGLIVSCTGCSAAADATAEWSQPPAPATAAPNFAITWLPVRLAAPSTPQAVPYDEPDGTTYPAEALDVASQSPSTSVLIQIVSAAAYPDAYVQGIASSTSLRQFTETGRPVALSLDGSSITALSENRGYLINVETKGVTESDVLHIVKGIRWKQ